MDVIKGMEAQLLQLLNDSAPPEKTLSQGQSAQWPADPPRAAGRCGGSWAGG
jgi:hypothetical protein